MSAKKMPPSHINLHNSISSFLSSPKFPACWARFGKTPATFAKFPQMSFAEGESARFISLTRTH